MSYQSNNNDNSNSTTYTATYSPEDNKLRLYASSRLDAATYARVKSAGFKWAPRQGFFVAPMWTPGREDLLLELCGEIEDEDKSLAERAEERSERFSEYSVSRTEDADHAQKAVTAIADAIPFGQPILIGHHSEGRHRKAIERIDNGMRRAVKMWDTANIGQTGQRPPFVMSGTKNGLMCAPAASRDWRPTSVSRNVINRRPNCGSNCGPNAPTSGIKSCSKLSRCELLACAICICLARKETAKTSPHTPTAYDALKGSYPNLYAPRTVDEIVAVALDK